MRKTRGDGRGVKMSIGLAALAIGVAAPAAAASAHDVTATISVPPTAVVEDTAFAIGFAGDMTTLPDGEGYIDARIRPGTQTPCAATDVADPGARVVIGAGRLVGAFSVAGNYTADEPGTYLVCAWITAQGGESGPPARASVIVRPPVLRLAGTAPERVAPAEPFDVTVDYEAEVSRYLTAVLYRGTRCPIQIHNFGALIGEPAGIVTDNVAVTGPGSVTATIRLAQAGTYSVCAYLDEALLGSQRADLVVQAATVTVVPPFRACGAVGGRRAIHSIRARIVSCAAAKLLARRWAKPRRAPRRIGAYRCFTRSGSVTCTAGSAQVRFRYRPLRPERGLPGWSAHGYTAFRGEPSSPCSGACRSRGRRRRSSAAVESSGRDAPASQVLRALALRGADAMETDADARGGSAGVPRQRCARHLGLDLDSLRTVRERAWR